MRKGLQIIMKQKIYFEATKEKHPNTYNFLHNVLKDDSANYVFKILAAGKILNIFSKNQKKLQDLSQKYFKDVFAKKI